MSRSKGSKRRVDGQQVLREAFESVDHEPLFERLGVHIREDLFMLSLTHRSFAYENGMLPHNERLEFLGDSILGLSVADQLYRQYPDRPESDISKMRASMVSRYGLADIAREIGLGQHILLGKGERATNGQDKDSILADTTEAIFGAVYLEHGFDTAREVILRLFKYKIDHASAQGLHADWKTALQNLVSERRLPQPEYETSSVGPDHDLVFTAIARVDEAELGTGKGPSKKQAEQQAARVAFHALRDNVTTLPDA